MIVDGKESMSNLHLSAISKTNSEKSTIYLDLFTSNEIAPNIIVSFQEYLLVVIKKTHIHIDHKEN